MAASKAGRRRAGSYDSLNSTKHEIRVLSLMPAAEHEEICCELQVVSLSSFSWTDIVLKDFCLRHVEDRWTYALQYDIDEARRQYDLSWWTCGSHLQPTQIRAIRRGRGFRDIPYETDLRLPSCGLTPCCCFQALSYTWGSFSQGRTITLSGEAGFAVSDNLYAALRRLRYTDRTRRLWIDAICINQADIYERSSQVRLMANLYKQAAEVLVWLGDVDNEEAQRRADLIESRSSSDDFYQAHRPAWRMINVALMELIGDHQNSWFFRSWVVQEVVNASVLPKIQLGSCGGIWNDLRRAFFEFQNKTRTKGMAEAEQLTKNLDALRGGAWHQDRPSILHVASLTRNTNCSDPRDKVYSLLGMIPSAEAALIDVDYSPEATPGAVYTQATTAAITASRNLLAFCSIAPHPARTSILPSWTIDFASKSDFSFVTGDDKPQQWIKKRPFTEADVSFRSNILCVKGLVLDRIRTSIVPVTSQVGQGYSAVSYLVGDCAAEIVSSLRQLPGGDPYERLGKIISGHQKGPRNLDKNAQNSTEREELVQHAERNLCSQPVDRALTYDPQHFNDLFCVWDRLFSVRKRCSLLDHRTQEAGGTAAGITSWGPTPDEEIMAALMTTACGFLGTGLSSQRPGDIIALLYGCTLPAVLRLEEDDNYTFRGLAIVNGVSYGELKEIVPDLDLPEQVFNLR